MDNIMTNMKEWEEKFNKYCELEKKCLGYISCISEIKGNLTKLLGNQKKDDIAFYKSMIENSHFYLTSSLKIRKTKFVKDLSIIWQTIDSSREMDCLNKSNFLALLKDYEKMSKDIVYARENNTILTWVKDDKVESLQLLENDFNEVMEYHINLIEYFNKMTELEKNFYCGDKNIV